MECPPSDAPLGCSNHGSNTLLNLDALFAEGTHVILDPHQAGTEGACGLWGQLPRAAGLLFPSYEAADLGAYPSQYIQKLLVNRC
jgi:hypothetical protein